MSNLEFAWPYAALAILCLIPMWLLETRRARDRSVLWSPQTLVIKDLLGQAKIISFRGHRNWLLLLVWTLLTLALMRPQHVGEPIEIVRDGRNIMLVLDISESMEAKDMRILGQPASRLESAKDVLAEFIDKRHGDRLGLIVFGSESFLHSPLSFDYPT